MPQWLQDLIKQNGWQFGHHESLQSDENTILDQNGNIVTSFTVYNHAHVAGSTPTGVKVPTCTEDGYTGDLVCAECGSVIQTGSTIPKLNHNYQNGVRQLRRAGSRRSCSAALYRRYGAAGPVALAAGADRCVPDFCRHSRKAFSPLTLAALPAPRSRLSRGVFGRYGAACLKVAFPVEVCYNTNQPSSIAEDNVAMFNIGFSELILILLVAFVIVGPKDLPRVARALGRGVRNLKRWIDEFKEETGLDEAIDEFNKTSRELERTFKEADPRPDLKKARDDVKSALDDASKTAEQALKDQPQQEE